MSHHLLIAFAAADAPECQALLADLRLPNLQALLGLLEQGPADLGDAYAMSPPHERAHARALGLPVVDGQIAWAAAAGGGAVGLAQGWLSLCHFQIGQGQVSLLAADQLGLDEATSRALFAAFAPMCVQDGIALRFDSATRWHASGEPLRGLVCASLDRVSGRAVDAWMVRSPDNPAHARLLQRLHSEAQMLFYTHQAHDERTAQGLLPVNGFWVHGAGALSDPLVQVASPRMPDTLRQAALRADWAGWKSAWLALDASDIGDLLAAARRGEPVRLTLCGERHARTWHLRPSNGFSRLRRRLSRWMGRVSVNDSLKSL